MEMYVQIIPTKLICLIPFLMNSFTMPAKQGMKAKKKKKFFVYSLHVCLSRQHGLYMPLKVSTSTSTPSHSSWSHPREFVKKRIIITLRSFHACISGYYEMQNISKICRSMCLTTPTSCLHKRLAFVQVCCKGVIPAHNINKHTNK